MDRSKHQAALEAYRQYNDSPLQRHLRTESPTLVGAVYWNPGDETEEYLRYELQRMKDTGFTFVRFHGGNPIEHPDGSWDFSFTDRRFDIAHEVGLLVYPHMGLNKFPTTACQRAGIDPAEGQARGITDPVIAELYRERIHALVTHYKDHPALAAWPLVGEHNATGIPLRDERDQAGFLAWLQAHYDTPEAVYRAWAIYPDRPPGVSKPTDITSWDDAVAMAARIEASDGGPALATTGVKRPQLFGCYRDLVRFRVDTTDTRFRLMTDIIHEVDPDHPVCFGAHQFFYANGEFAWDQFSTSRVGDMHFSSIHLSWHFESVAGEVDRPHYMQARLTKDAFKGGYGNCYETTGGPVQFSGGYGNHMDAGLMRRMMLNYLAAGNQGIAFWTWQTRPGGHEAGEYGLLSLSGAITPWAEEAGRIAKAMDRYRREIWHWQLDPELAIVRSWDTDTIMGLETTRHGERGLTRWSSSSSQQHIRAWIGASRVAIDHQVDFEYLDTSEIEAGLAEVYPSIYLPHLRCVSDAVLERLLAYVEAGGELIADVQLGFEDQWAKVRTPGRGSLVERLFGAWIDNIHDSRTRPLLLDGEPCPGFYGDLCTSDAHIVRVFDNGAPAMSECRRGQGRATLIATDLARACWRPDEHIGLGAILADCYRAGRPRRWHCGLPQTIRRSHPDADHYFIINDGPARSSVLRVFDHQYRQIEDVLDGSQIDAAGTIPVQVAAHSGLWLRCVR